MRIRAILTATLPFLVAAPVFTTISSCGPPTETTVTFTVDMGPAFRYEVFDDAIQTIGIRGSVRPLSWAESWPMEDPDGDTVYTATVVFPFRDADQILDYKFKIDGDEEFWEMHRNRQVPLNGRRQVVYRVFDDPPPDLEPSFTGNTVELESRFVSRYLYTGRSVYVYLPPGYNEAENAARRYPVLYMHDGQNIFDRSEVGAEWKFDETAERLIGNGSIEPVIIVAIGNSRHRTTEYTPPSEEGVPEKSSGDDYGRALVEELIPVINRSYRTLTGPENTSLGGSSLGGLITMYIGIRYPDTFGGLLLVSPSVTWSDAVILDVLSESDKPDDQRIWLDMGTDEGDNMLSGARQLRDSLVVKGWTLDDDLKYVEAIGAVHHERAWAARGEDMLRFLYGNN